MDVYLAAPIVGITDEQRNMIETVKSRLGVDGVSLHVPGDKKIPNAWGMTQDEWARCVFTNDVLTISSCDWVVVCDFGRHLTAGTAWECGYAFGIGRKVLLIEMDGGDDHSLMLRGCSTNYCTYDELVNSDISELLIERGRIQRTGITLN